MEAEWLLAAGRERNEERIIMEDVQGEEEKEELEEKKEETLRK